MPIDLNLITLEVLRNPDGMFRNMFEVARELFPDDYHNGVEAIRGFLNDYDDLDIDDEGEVYEA